MRSTQLWARSKSLVEATVEAHRIERAKQIGESAIVVRGSGKGATQRIADAVTALRQRHLDWPRNPVDNPVALHDVRTTGAIKVSNIGTISVSGRLDDAAARARAYAPFLGRMLDRHAGVVDKIAAGSIDEVLRVAGSDDTRPIASRLRIERGRIMLAVALADLSGIWPLEPVVAALSDFADYALDAAITEAIHGHAPGSEARGFVAIALGKHGSRELNFSSDIDPIFLYDPDVLPRRRREEPAEAAVRIARRVIDLLQTRDGDGFVFRVDLRLRPASEATPIALPIDAAIAHYESSALAWERVAFIRARAASGDLALGQRFLAVVQPFVWRRSLDFGAIGDLRALTHAIRDHHGGQLLGPGFDVKRGRGGIREVEFFAQIHQLIHGGRDPALRIGATLPALAALADAGRIDGAEAVRLADAYRCYRTVEHRLQMIDDRQTHRLPAQSDDLDAVARLHALSGGDALVALLRPHVEYVGALYDNFDTAADDRRSSPTHLSDSPFSDPAGADARIARWRAGGIRAIRSPAAIAAFEAMLPDLLADLSSAPDPDAALARLDRVLGQLSSGVNLFRLLEAQPALRVLLVDVLSHAPTLADAIAARPALLDRLVDGTALGEIPTVAVLAEEMRARGEVTTEAQLDRARHIVGEYRFALGVQIIEGAADPLAVAAGYARVAEAAIEVVAARAIHDFEASHGQIPDGGLVILALGRLGGGLLTHASDLDLIYLFSGDDAADSDSARPLGATRYFNRLGQRLTAALSVPTSVGSLYDVDTRLRPSGAQGPLVVSLDSFERYQQESAWTWEHLALARARPVFGRQADRDTAQAIIDATLSRPRDRSKLVADVVAMRTDIATHKAI